MLDKGAKPKSKLITSKEAPVSTASRTFCEGIAATLSVSVVRDMLEAVKASFVVTILSKNVRT